MRRLILSLAILVCAFSCQSCLAQGRAIEEQSHTRNRIALLIGNGAYLQSAPEPALAPFPKLRNPCNDVTRVAARLERAGWASKEIIQLCDGTRSQIIDAVEQFKDIYMSAEPAFGFVYYAGHGVQIGEETYLFGIDSYVNPAKIVGTATTHASGSIFKGGVRLFGDIISQVGDAGEGSIFIVIDACRQTLIDQLAHTNPNISKDYFALTHGYPRPVFGIKLLYSTAYGDLASDGVAGGSPFALAFEEQMKGDGRVDALVARVIRAVRERTQFSTLRQMPDTTGSLNPPPPDGCLTACGVDK